MDNTSTALATTDNLSFPIVAFELDNDGFEDHTVTMNIDNIFNSEPMTVSELAASLADILGNVTVTPLTIADISFILADMSKPTDSTDSLPDRAQIAFERIKRSRRFGKKAPFFDIETKERYYAPEDVLDRAASDPEFLGRCITFLYLEQTGDERVQRTTRWDNDRGFSLRTVTNGTLLAELLDKGCHLIPGSPWHEKATAIVYHHRQQLANQCNRLAALEVLPF